MLGKERKKVNASSYDVYIIGEYIRLQMHKVGLIKDRRYHLRKYRQCFVGRDAIDWLIKQCHAQSRGEAIMAVRCLQEHGMLHHVVDDHVFKDQNLFYRFTRDDDRYLLRTDLTAFYRGLDVFHRVKEGRIQREFYHRGHLYQGAFYGMDLVDCLTASDDKVGRHDIIRQCRELLEYNIIRHVTDDYHFADDRLMYQFHVDYDRSCLLSDVLRLPAANATDTHRHSSGSATYDASSSNSSVDRPLTQGSRINIVASDSNRLLAPQRSSVDSNNSSILCGSQPDTFPISGADDDLGNDSDASATAILSPSLSSGRGSAFSSSAPSRLGDREMLVRRVVKLYQDEVGYGFVLRGSSPCYVHTIDPLGPAAAAGLKEGQYVLSVNGQNMTQQDHRYVGRVVMSQSGLLTMVVLRQTSALPL